MKAAPTETPSSPVEVKKSAEASNSLRSASSAGINFGRLRISKKIIVAAGLVCLPLLYFYPAVIGEVLLAPGDGWAQNLGVRVLIGQMIARGEVPLWDPYIFAGMPLLASVYPGALYPPNWVFALFSPGVAVNVVVITTYHLALIGAYLYARSIGGGRVSAIITGAVFTFSAYMVGHVGHPSRIAAAAWLPWVLLAVEHLYQRASWRWVALGALFVALQLFAGEPQMTFLTALTAGAYALFSLTLRERQARRWRFAAAGLAMAAGGALLSAVQLLPARELLQQSDRAQLSYEYFSYFSLPPKQALMLLFPYFFGGYSLPPYKILYWGAWHPTTTCSYVGVLSLMLCLIAVLGPRQLTGESRKAKDESGMREGGSLSTGRSLSPFAFSLSPLIWFWALTAVVSFVLAFGPYLPFGLYHLLHRTPVYNLFRGSYRHLVQFSFAAAALAGLGVSYLAHMPGELVRRALVRSTGVLTAVMAGAVIIYRFFQQPLEVGIPRPVRANSLANAEVWVPLCCLVLGVIVCWFYARRRGALAGAWLVTVMVADLASFGLFFDWRTIHFSMTERLADGPLVKRVKEREPDWSAFRILSQPLYGYGLNYELLDSPNISIVRGLQNISGYDVLRLPRLGAVAGELDVTGVARRGSAFGLADQGLNLLNLKYLFHERPTPLALGQGLVYDGVPFSEIVLDLHLKPGSRAEFTPDGAAATELALVTTMANALHIPDGVPVAAVRLYTKDGRMIEREIQAGRDTAEWAYDRAETRPVAKHQRARVAESWEAGGFEGHRYLARLPFERAEVVRVVIDYLRDDAALVLMRGSLFDAPSGTAYPLDAVSLPPEKWRKLESHGQVDLYENLKAMPRAWFVTRLAAEPSAEVLRTIREGRLRDGGPFDPAEVALLETEDFGGRAVTLPAVGEAGGAKVKVTDYRPQRIELETHHPRPGFLVLSEIYYRGWEARIDGRKTPVYRADYTLRGIAVPAGDHRIAFVFRAPSFRTGAVYSALGAVLLLGGAVVSRVRLARGDKEDGG